MSTVLEEAIFLIAGTQKQKERMYIARLPLPLSMWGVTAAISAIEKLEDAYTLIVLRILGPINILQQHLQSRSTRII